MGFGWMSGTVALAIAAAAGAATAMEAPLLGVDMAGSYHIYHAKQEYWALPAYHQAVEELGTQFVNVHVYAETAHGADSARMMAEKIARIDAGMRSAGLKYVLNVEDSNYNNLIEITPGVNEFEQPDGCHRWDLRMEWLEPLLEANATSGTAFLGVLYDEPIHMQNETNRSANLQVPGATEELDAPFFANTDGLSVTEAWSALCLGAEQIREHY
jgi:hypothetical protein